MAKLIEEMKTEELNNEWSEIQDNFKEAGICQCEITRLLDLERELLIREEQP